MARPGYSVLEGLVRPDGPLDHVTRWVALIGLIGLLGITLVIVADVILRGLFNRPIEGLEDIAKFTFAIVVASCFPAGLIQGHNVAIRFLGKGLGDKPTTWLETFAAFCTLVFFLLLAWQFAVFTLDEMAHNRYTQTLQLPTPPFWWVVTGIIAITVPIQLVVLALWIKRTLKGEKPILLGREDIGA